MNLENNIENNIENNMKNNIENTVEIKNDQKNFLNNTISKIINNGIDIGIRALLPDLIENQIIDIKNALLENGLKGGIQTAINSAIDFGKSVTGIFTGEFQNINQVETAIGNGGILDTISNVLDDVVNKAYQKGKINYTVNNLIKKGKDVIINNVSNNIKNELDYQSNSIEKLNTYINNWKEYYNNKNFEGMEKEYNKMKIQIDNVLPIENTLKEVRTVENLHLLIKNNGQNFNITESELKLAENLS